MKKIWARKKDEEAVSPVIATILMVAITVVLAAVLYVMVLGFTPGGGGGNIVLAMSQDETSDNYTLTVTSISGTLLISGASLVVKTADGNTASGPTGSLEAVNGTWSDGFKFNDVNEDGKVSAQDYFQLDNDVYLVGSKVAITNTAGTTTYTESTIQ